MIVITRTKSDADKLFARQSHHLAFHDVVVRQFGKWNEARQDAFFDANWNDALLEIVLYDGTPYGYTAIEEFPGRIEVRELVIHPDFQNKGIGSAVLRQVMDRAVAQNAKVTLGVLHQNRAAELYRRLGFVECGRTETHLLMEWIGGLR